MLIEITLNEFRNLALLPSAKIVEHFDDAAPVVELGDNRRRYVSLDVNIACMDTRNELKCLTHKDILNGFDIKIANDRIYSDYNSSSY